MSLSPPGRHALVILSAVRFLQLPGRLPLKEIPVKSVLLLLTSIIMLMLGSTSQSSTPSTPPPGREILAFAGSVHAPAGHTVAGTIVVACFPQGDDCDEKKSRLVSLTTSGTTAHFNLADLSSTPYALFAWQDRDGDGTPSVGDLFAVHSTHAQEAALITPPMSGFVLNLAVMGSDDSTSEPVEPGVVKGVARNRHGQPLAGVRIDVINAADRYGSNIVTHTNPDGSYRVNVPLGSWTAQANLPVVYHGAQTCLPLEESDRHGFWHADGAVRNFTLHIRGPRPFSDGSIGSWGGTLEVATRFALDPWSSDPVDATVRFLFEPDGPLMDGSVGERFELSGTVDLRGFSIFDIPLGRYRVHAGLLEPDGSYTPLDIQAYLDNRLTNDNIIAFDEVTSRSCGAIEKRSVIVLSALE